MKNKRQRYCIVGVGNTAYGHTPGLSQTALNVLAIRAALEDAGLTTKDLHGVLTKARFWQRFAGTPMNERQVKLLNRLLDGFEGKLTSSKWAAIGKCSPDTALRDITQLVTLGALRKSAGGGRSTGYELVDASHVS